MSVVKTIELSGRSSEGFEDAVRQTVQRASCTIRNIQSVWVKEFEGVRGCRAWMDQPARERLAGESTGELRQDEQQHVTRGNPGKGRGQRPRDCHGRVGE